MVHSREESFFSVVALSGNCRICLFFLIAGFFSCHSPDLSGPGHSYYSDPVFIRADSFDADQKGRAFAFLDSVYNAFPDPGPGDLYKKYDYKRHYFFETRKDYPRAMIYVDSQLWAIRGRTDEKEFIED